MGIHSGRFGKINGINTVRNWNLSETMTPAMYVASNTRFGHGRKEGVRQWNGSFGVFGAAPIVMPGDFLAFEGYTAPTTDVDGDPGKTYAGSAYIDSVQLTWNWNSGELLAHMVNFSGHLGLTVGDDTVVDVVEPDPERVCGTKITYDPAGGGGEVEITNLVQAQLTLSCPNVPYVNSSTNCLTGRKKGIVDWTLALTHQGEERDVALDIGDDLDLRLYIDATQFWRLTWGHVHDYSGLQVDPESGAIIQRTINISMNGFLAGASSPGPVGAIRVPGASSDWWPE